MNYGEFNGKRILQRNSFEKMIEIQNPASGGSYLWWNYLGDRIGHLGGGTGFSTWVEWNLEDESGMFIFSNKVNGAIAPGGSIYELVRYQSYKY